MKYLIAEDKGCESRESLQSLLESHGPDNAAASLRNHLLSPLLLITGTGPMTSMPLTGKTQKTPLLAILFCPWFGRKEIHIDKTPQSK